MTVDLKSHIRPLIWEEDGVDAIIAKTPWGAYKVFAPEFGISVWQAAVGGWTDGADFTWIGQGYWTKSAAKSAARRDHIRRVMRALQ